jgi:hypothetical protein
MVEHGFGNRRFVSATAKATLRGRPIHTALPGAQTAAGISKLVHQACSARTCLYRSASLEINSALVGRGMMPSLPTLKYSRHTLSSRFSQDS